MQKQQKPDLRDLVEPARARSKPTGATTAFLPPRLIGHPGPPLSGPGNPDPGPNWSFPLPVYILIYLLIYLCIIIWLFIDL